MKEVYNIRQGVYKISSPSFDKCPAPDRPEFAFIGRSNVGKSSLINMIANNDKLVKTSSSPGKTQLINHFNFTSTNKDSGKDSHWFLVDLPGYGFAKVSQSSRRRWEQMIENYLRKRENIAMVFVLIDSRHTPQKIDLEFLDQLRKWQVPFSLVFTKSDKETQSIVAKNVKMFLDKLRETWQFLPQHFLTSAEKRSGRQKLLGHIHETSEEWYEGET